MNTPQKENCNPLLTQNIRFPLRTIQNSIKSEIPKRRRRSLSADNIYSKIMS